MIKRILTAILCLVLLPLGAGARLESASGVADDKTEALISFGIMDDEDAGNKSSFVTRAMFAKYVSLIMGYNGQKPSEYKLNDVDENTEYGENIEFVVSSKYMNGYINGDFAPNDYITLEQAVKTLVLITGYDAIIDKTDYPRSYLNVAARYKMTDKVMAAEGAYLTAADCSALIYNALNMPMLKIESIGKNVNYKTDDDITLLSEMLGIYRYKGTVNAIPHACITSADFSMSDSQLVVGSTVFEEGCIDGSAFLGSRIVFYAKETDKSMPQEIIYVEEILNEDDIIIIDSRDIEDGSTLTDIKYSDNSRIKKAEISKNAVYVINGRESNRLTDSDLEIESGSIRLVASGGSSLYNVVYIESYITAVVSGIDSINGDILLKYSMGAIPAEKNGDKAEFDVFYRDNIKIDVSEIREGDTLKIAADKMYVKNGKRYIDFDNSEYYKIYVSDEVVTGKIDAISSDGEIIVTVDGKDYPVSESYRILMESSPETVDVKSLELGDEASFYIDCDNTVAGYFSGAQQSERYGFIVNFAKESNLSKNVDFKIYTDGGRMDIYKSADRMVVDGTTYKSSDAILGRFSYIKDDSLTTDEAVKRRVIVFKTNDAGRLSEIWTVNDNPANDDDALIQLKKHGEMTYNWDASSFYTDKSNYFFTARGTTKVISVPVVKDIMNEQLYSAGTFNGFVDGTKYNISGYAKNKKYRAEVLVQTTAGNVINDSTAIVPSVLVEKVYYTLDSDGNMAQALIGWRYSVRETFFAENDGQFDNIKSGDIVRIEKSNHGTVSDIEKCYSPDLRSLPKIISDAGLKQMFVGHVYNKEDSIIELVTEGDAANPVSTRIVNLLDDGTEVYFYDVANKKVTIGHTNDIKDYKHFPGDEAIMYIHMRDWTLLGLVVYKF